MLFLSNYNFLKREKQLIKVQKKIYDKICILKTNSVTDKLI